MVRLLCHWDEAAAYQKSDFAKKKIMKQWSHTCKAFGVYHLIVIGTAEAIPVLGDAEIKVEVFRTYAEAREKYEGEQFVVLIQGGEPLVEFRHPSDAVYVVGSNYADPVVCPGDLMVGIDAKIPLWDVVAAGIVLHSRR